MTGDEEGPAVNGTATLLRWMEASGRAAPTPAWSASRPRPEVLGDMMKIGRRGSANGTLVVEGTPGPHRLSASRRQRRRTGSCTCWSAIRRRPSTPAPSFFEPANLQVTTIDIGNPAGNVIPARGHAPGSTSATTTCRTATAGEPGCAAHCDAAGGTYRAGAALQRRRLPDQARPVHRSGRRSRRGITGRAPGGLHQRRHLGRALRQALLPRGRAGPGRARPCTRSTSGSPPPTSCR